MNILWKVSSRFWLVLGFGCSMATLSCQAGHGAQPSRTQAQVAATEKGSTVNPEISLKVDTSNERAIVHVVWKNHSQTDTYLFDPWQVFRDNMMEGSLLQIAEDGRKVQFLDPVAKRRASEEKDLVRLEPGQKLEGEQDTTGKYDFAPGTHTYTLQYAAFLQVSSPEKYVEVRSQPISFTLTK